MTTMTATTSEFTAAMAKKTRDIFKVLRMMNLPNRTEEILDSLEEQFLDKNLLTPKQYELLLSIYERC